jgi:hypothetical protein
MPSSLSRQDPMQGQADTASQVARPQHHDIFLEPRYTIELPPLNDGEGEGEGDQEFYFDRPVAAAPRRRPPSARRG